MRAKDLVSSSQFYSLRLQPGAELIEQLRQFIQVNHIKAGWIASVVGSLSSVSLRYAGCEWTSLIEGKFEVIALGGTLDSQFEHLHMSVADETGRVIAGHVMSGNIVRTTIELIIGELCDVEFSRQHCVLSGYDELVITSKEG
ncbi:PPC domain-containing DNA-binding protein [Hafnia paralvei]|uniref:PPC domain-containing DNA-binding protein n=1 Tax=Hafnia paralvei TaxID=546367 RepID=UPI003CFA7A0F